MEVVPDDFALIEDRLHHYVDERCDLIFTTGGTGLTPDDITPEATRAVIEREAPGFAEAMRAEGAKHTPHGILTRGVSGHRRPDADRQLPGLAEGDRPALPRALARRSSTWCAPCAGTRRTMTSADAPAIELHRPRAGLRRAGRAGRRLADARARASTLAVFGANGAGKTTLLRILATLLRPHRGRARVLGSELPRDGWAVRGRIGFLGHEPLLYRDLTARENLRFHARLHGVPDDAGRRAARRGRPRPRAPTTPCTRSRAGWSSAPRSAGRCCTSRSCCCSTSRPRGLDPAAADAVARADRARRHAGGQLARRRGRRWRRPTSSSACAPAAPSSSPRRKR